MTGAAERMEGQGEEAAKKERSGARGAPRGESRRRARARGEGEREKVSRRRLPRAAERCACVAFSSQRPRSPAAVASLTCTCPAVAVACPAPPSGQPSCLARMPLPCALGSLDLQLVGDVAGGLPQPSPSSALLPALIRVAFAGGGHSPRRCGSGAAACRPRQR